MLILHINNRYYLYILITDFNENLLVDVNKPIIGSINKHVK